MGEQRRQTGAWKGERGWRQDDLGWSRENVQHTTETTMKSYLNE